MNEIRDLPKYYAYILRENHQFLLKICELSILAITFLGILITNNGFDLGSKSAFFFGLFGFGGSLLLTLKIILEENSDKKFESDLWTMDENNTTPGRSPPMAAHRGILYLLYFSGLEVLIGVGLIGAKLFFSLTTYPWMVFTISCVIFIGLAFQHNQEKTSSSQ
jgi:hypothetical protein